MAWVFSLSIECGSEKTRAEDCAHYFDGLSLQRSDQQIHHCSASLFQDLEENWWCRVCPDKLSEIGIDAPQMAYVMTELGILLYRHLQSAPPFRYALAGVEVDEFRTYSELQEDAAVLGVLFPGLVLSEETWRSLSCPSAFRPFRSGYVWKRYEGEVYRPLIASPDLTDKLNELLILQ
ncbi:hypothetical protein LEP3755_51230 [Leptolyngbya sp. NIES-3755]|nr:hypothetical protein LEP3755_51230 [Leptolyngbya sp. NIES-3755]